MKGDYMSSNKALFIVSSSSQIDMFNSIIKELDEFQIKFINTQWLNTDEISNLLKKKNMISRLSTLLI